MCIRINDTCQGINTVFEQSGCFLPSNGVVKKFFGPFKTCKYFLLAWVRIVNIPLPIFFAILTCLRGSTP